MVRLFKFLIIFSCEADWKVVTYRILGHKTFRDFFRICTIDMVDY